MATIQEIGGQILSGNFQKFYVFGGPEYGIKCKYLEMIRSKYSNKVEVPTVAEILSTMKTKRIIPLQPTLYIVRYDEEFVSKLNESLANEIRKCKIVGTIVCIYENEKHFKKCEKFLPEFSVCIDTVSPQFVFQYLKKDYPKLSDRLINISIAASPDYNSASNMCEAMASVGSNRFNSTSDDAIVKMFGREDISTEKQISLGVASKNFRYLMNAIDRFDGTTDSIIYTILSTLLELEKLLDNKYTQSDLRDYAKIWNHSNIYNMFMNSYAELKKIRSSTQSDTTNSLIYLFGLLQFSAIPAVEVMS